MNLNFFRLGLMFTSLPIIGSLEASDEQIPMIPHETSPQKWEENRRKMHVEQVKIQEKIVEEKKQQELLQNKKLEQKRIQGQIDARKRERQRAQNQIDANRREQRRTDDRLWDRRLEDRRR